MDVILMALVGGVFTAALWLGVRPTFTAPLFGRVNHRGAVVPVGAGILLAVTTLFVAAIDRSFTSIGFDHDPVLAIDLVLIAALGFGLLGFIDDVAETGSDKGFAGHLGAMREGRLTTGGMKLLGGLALAALLAAYVDGDHLGWFVVDALLIAGAANVGNLFDRAPGRTTKVAVLAAAVLFATNWSDAPTGVAVVVGGGLGLLAFDLREELMLGDAGANVLGAAIGLGVVLACSFPVRVGALVAVIALNALSEVVSFSAVIARTPGLRDLDRLGRKP